MSHIKDDLAREINELSLCEFPLGKVEQQQGTVGPSHRNAQQDGWMRCPIEQQLAHRHAATALTRSSRPVQANQIFVQTRFDDFESN